MTQLAKLSDYKVEPDGYHCSGQKYLYTFGYYRYYFGVSLPDKNIFDTFMRIKRNNMKFSLKRVSYHEDHIREKLIAYTYSLADYVDLDWWW